VQEGVEGDRRPDLKPHDVAQGIFDDVALDHQGKCSTARVLPRHDQLTIGTTHRTRTRTCGENGTLMYEFNLSLDRNDGEVVRAFIGAAERVIEPGGQVDDGDGTEATGSLRHRADSSNCEQRRDAGEVTWCSAGGAVLFRRPARFVW
jgi:hypothetical protein